MDTNCVPILGDFYFYSYQANFIKGLPKTHEKKLVRSFYFPLRYTGDVLSLYKFDFVDRIYLIDLEIKDTQIQLDMLNTLTYTLKIIMMTSEKGIYNKKHDFNFRIVNFAFICRNIPVAPTYLVYLSMDMIFQRMWFLSCLPKEWVAAIKEVTQPRVKLKSSLRKL